MDAEEDADEMTFELDDIEGDGIYLVDKPTAEATVEETEETAYDPFDMSIDEAMGDKEVEFEAEKQEEPIAETQEETPKKVVHTLDDLRLLEERLQIKSPVQEEREPEQQPVQAAVEEDEDLRFEVKVKEEPSTSKQEQVPEDDFLNRPISPAMKQKILERKRRLEEFNYTFRHTTTELLEKEPAYKRQGLDLGADNYSGNSEVSRFSLGGDDDDTHLRTNNSFLHDNVD